MELIDFNLAINNFEQFLLIKNTEINKGYKSEELFKDKWNKAKDELNKEYLDLKLQVIKEYELDLKHFDLAFISIYIGDYSKNVNHILYDGPINYLQDKTLEDIEINYDHYILGDIITNQYGIRHNLVSNIETIFDELYEEESLNPFMDEKEAFMNMLTVFYLMKYGLSIDKHYPEITKDEQINLVLTIFPKVKERNEKLDKLDSELFYKLRELNMRYEKLYHKLLFGFTDYESIDTATKKYLLPIKVVYGEEIYKLFKRISNKVVESDQKRFITLAKKVNIKTTEDLYNVIDGAFYGNF